LFKTRLLYQDGHIVPFNSKEQTKQNGQNVVYYKSWS